ncbi:MAG: FHA domain-containing protein [Proteobacteria bacterium]|nr:FHA domain-containing protein [Pseudomonadota bacterium]
MAAKNRPGPSMDVDLEATDELPALDLAEAGEAQVNTDIFPGPVIPAGMAELADSLRDVEHRLQRKIERVQKLETELQLAGSQQQQLDIRLREQGEAAAAREAGLRAEISEASRQHAELAGQQAASQRDLAAARDELQQQRLALNAAQAQLTQQNSERTHQDHDLTEWRRRAERAYEALTTWQGFRAVSDALLGESDAALQSVESRHAAELAAVEAREGALEKELSAARADATQRLAALEESLRRADQAAEVQTEALRIAIERANTLAAQVAARDASMADQQQQLDALRVVEEKARQGAATYDSQVQQIATLQASLADAEARVRDLQQQLRQATDRVDRLESEAHASAALLGNLQQNMERLGRDDTGARPVLKEAPLENIVRVLIRQEGGAEVMYPIGRHTTVGRTPENDIQIDTTYISRHHAVLLSSADACIVEDLNSTNGVLVNGRRVGRQVLHDGDTVTIGKTEFRYQQRS